MVENAELSLYKLRAWQRCVQEAHTVSGYAWLFQKLNRRGKEYEGSEGGRSELRMRIDGVIHIYEIRSHARPQSAVKRVRREGEDEHIGRA